MSKSGSNAKKITKKHKDAPYARETRSNSKKRDTPTQSPESSHIESSAIDNAPAVEIINSDDRPGPSWSDFDKLKNTVHEMHDLLKSFTEHASSSANVPSQNVSVDMLDNHINTRPREVGEFGNPSVSVVQQPSTSGAIDQSSVNEYLRSFVHTGTSINQGETYFQPGRPIDLKVNEKIRQKIWSDQFIDLASLLDPQVNSEIGITITGDPGEPLKFTQNKSNKTIGNLGQWCSAFEIFITIYCQKRPQDLSPLMSYMNAIKTLSHKGGDYFTYDREFRYMRQNSNLPWDLVHSGLWLECRDKNPKMSNRNKSSSNTDNFRGKSQQGKTKQHPFGYCFRFHNFGKCGRSSCKFKHTCYECHDEAHSFSRCPKQSKPSSTTTSFE